MHPRTLLIALVISVASFVHALSAPAVTIEVAATFQDQQVTGVAVSKEGRMFVNFPFWSDKHTVSVAEVLKDGTLKPYPDDAWNKKDGSPGKRWICVQSVYVDADDTLWILDPASPKMEGVVEGGAKLVKVDLAENKVVEVIGFDESIAPSKSYLNDVRIDRKSSHAFITESGTGAIVVVNLKDHTARRLLGNSPTTRAEPEMKLVVDGFNLVDPKTGIAPQIHADGIALDEKAGWLYFHALTARSLHRIQTVDLLNAALTEADLAKKVETVATTAACDGMIMSPEGGVYITAFERNAIEYWDGKNDRSVVILEDQRLQWPDSFSWGPDNVLYVTTSQIHRQPKYHGGVSRVNEPYHVYRLTFRNP